MIFVKINSVVVGVKTNITVLKTAGFSSNPDFTLVHFGRQQVSGYKIHKHGFFIDGCKQVGKQIEDAQLYKGHVAQLGINHIFSRFSNGRLSGR